MGYLLGLKEYLSDGYNYSIFQQALDSADMWALHLHGNRVVQAKIVEDLTYDVKLALDNKKTEELSKIQIKCLYPVNLMEPIKAMLTMNEQVQAMEIEPIVKPQDRYVIKNKSLFPLMKQQQNVVLTLLEGEVLHGIVIGFSRYDLMFLVQGIPIVILRHSIYDLQDSNGRSFRKSFQQEHRDWEKSELFCE
ncbi:MAG: hypothetical protein HQM14_09470 [SAR324 cluster bacterium]|nr:hypothetical protein [SAR324 cluster bacterium]